MIADLSTLWVNFNIYPKDLQHIRQGQEIFIATGQDTPDVENTIAYIAPVVKEETRTALARVILPNPAGLWRAGMFVTARVVVGEGEEAALVVPKTALQTVEEKTMVFVATPQGFEAEPVQVGRSNATHVEITSGLSAGATYALTGTFTLKAQLSKSAFGDGHGH
jgi:cobalt-zinc-cadmium efflux system membrane fusion protein